MSTKRIKSDGCERDKNTKRKCSWSDTSFQLTISDEQDQEDGVKNHLQCIKVYGHPSDNDIFKKLSTVYYHSVLSMGMRHDEFKQTAWYARSIFCEINDSQFCKYLLCIYLGYLENFKVDTDKFIYDHYTHIDFFKSIENFKVNDFIFKSYKPKIDDISYGKTFYNQFPKEINAPQIIQVDSNIVRRALHADKLIMQLNCLKEDGYMSFNYILCDSFIYLCNENLLCFKEFVHILKQNQKNMFFKKRKQILDNIDNDQWDQNS